MDRFAKAKDYLNSVNRNVLLAVGLVVIAGLITAVFVYGDAGDDIATGDNDTTVGEEVTNGTTPTPTDNDDTTDGNDTENNTDTDTDTTPATGATDGANGSPALPAELADTGPAAPVVAVGLLAGSLYAHRRSRRQVRAAQLDR